MSLHNVFVYGTLKRGEPNHNWINDTSKGSSEFIGVATTAQKYPLVIASKYNIPFLLDAPGVGNNVTGEVYRVDEGMLHHLDELEDHPNFYVRELQQVQLHNTSPGSQTNNMNCWIYLLKNFKQSLLNQQLFKNYSSNGPHGLRYAERYQRDPSYSAKDDVKDYTLIKKSWVSLGIICPYWEVQQGALAFRVTALISEIHLNGQWEDSTYFVDIGREYIKTWFALNVADITCVKPRSL